MHAESISAAVVEAVATRKGVDPTELPPLHDAIDPDALESVVATGADGGGVFFVEFEFAGCIVTVDDTDVSTRPLP